MLSPIVGKYLKNLFRKVNDKQTWKIFQINEFKYRTYSTIKQKETTNEVENDTNKLLSRAGLSFVRVCCFGITNGRHLGRHLQCVHKQKNRARDTVWSVIRNHSSCVSDTKQIKMKHKTMDENRNNYTYRNILNLNATALYLTSKKENKQNDGWKKTDFSPFKREREERLLKEENKPYLSVLHPQLKSLERTHMENQLYSNYGDWTVVTFTVQATFT